MCRLPGVLGMRAKVRLSLSIYLDKLTDPPLAGCQYPWSTIPHRLAPIHHPDATSMFINSTLVAISHPITTHLQTSGYSYWIFSRDSRWKLVAQDPKTIRTSQSNLFPNRSGSIVCFLLTVFPLLTSFIPFCAPALSQVFCSFCNSARFYFINDIATCIVHAVVQGNSTDLNIRSMFVHVVACRLTEVRGQQMR